MRITQKTLTLETEGDEAFVLKDICELARRHFEAHKRQGNGAPVVDEYDERQTQQIRTLMTEIFDA